MSPFHDNVTPLPGPRPGDAAAWSVLASIQGTLALDLDAELGPRGLLSRSRWTGPTWCRWPPAPDATCSAGR